MLGRVCVPLLLRGFRVGYLWVQLDADEPNATAVLAQLPEVARELEQLSALLLESNTAESEFRRRREQEFLAACRGESNAVAAVGGWKEVQGRGPWQLVTVLDADGWAEGSDPIASTLIHRSAALQSTIGVDAALFSAGTETHSVVLFKESTGRADHAQVLVHYQLELAKRSGRAVASDHPGDLRGLRPAAGTGGRLPPIPSGRPGGGGGSPAGGARRLPRHRNLPAAGLGGRRSGGMGGRRLGLFPPSGGPRPEPRTAAGAGALLRQRRLGPGSGGQAASAPEQHLQPAGPDPAAARRRSAQGDGAAGAPRGAEGAALGGTGPGFSPMGFAVRRRQVPRPSRFGGSAPIGGPARGGRPHGLRRPLSHALFLARFLACGG